MNFYKDLTKKDKELLKDAGIIITDKEYTEEEAKHYEFQIHDYIMSKSSKNGDIARASSEYGDLLRYFGKRQ